MELKKMFKYLPVAILIIAMIYSIYVAASTNVMLTKKHYIGFSLLLVSVMFYFFNTRIAQVIMLTILILGTFDLVAFTPSITSTTFFMKLNGAGGNFLRIQHFSFFTNNSIYYYQFWIYKRMVE